MEMLRHRDSHRGRHRSLAVVTVAGLLLAAACTSNSNPKSNATGAATTSGGAQPASATLVVAMEQASLRTLDPNDAYEPAAFVFENALYSTLVTFKSDNLRKLEPRVAQSWTVNDDGTEYTFKLDPKAVFSTGDPVTAADVVFSMQRFINLKGPGAFLLGGVSSITAPSTDTVVFKLSAPDFTFPWILTSSALGVSEAKVVQAHGGNDSADAATTDKAESWLDGHSAGSGPFVLDSWTRGQQLVLSRNDNYWGPKPAYSKIIFKFVSDANTEQQLLKRGDAAIAVDLTPDQVTGLSSDQKIGVAKAPALNQIYLGWSAEAKNPALAKTDNWTAIKYAINYKNLVSLAQGAAVQAGSVVPSALEGSLSPEDGFSQDIAKAKAALAAAGNPDGFSFTLSYASDESAAGLPMSLVASAIQSDLAAVGIKAKLDPELEVNFLSAYRTGKLEAVVHGWANDYPATSDFLPVFVPPGTVAVTRQHWPASAANQQIVDLAANAFKTKDDTQRASMITQALKLLNQIGPYAPLLDTEYQFPYDKSKVTGVTANSLWFLDLDTMSPAS
jgi:peptide/nickel transport system substrate-binding protein